jgi:predicted dehydrogenase
VCDIDEGRLRAVGDEFSVPRRTRSFDEVLRMDDVDIVDICTPAMLHFEQILATLSARKEVVCEKPLVGSIAEIDRIIATEKATPGRVMPIFSVPFWQWSAKGQADHRVGDRRQALSCPR